ncbi:hypothetical protein [Mycobacterium avium]|uniref:hypothetical protein n=1 Tax=Mycobacterium avium TaxID=1764 RepID=UPI001E2A9774|nr:hypothetical protein [Mycobacterium avium]
MRWNPLRRSREDRAEAAERRRRLVAEYNRRTEHLRQLQMAIDPPTSASVNRRKLHTETEVLTKFLAGGENYRRSQTLRTGPGYNPDPRDQGSLICVGSGWELLIRLNPTTYLLSMDIPSLETPRSAETWRAKVMAAAARAGVKILPASEPAYRKAAWYRGSETAWRDTEVIHTNDSREAVFRIADNYYLTGYDSQEDPPLYFLCQLPHRVETVDEARRALMPESVKTALAQGLQVMRQGDIFAIESDLTTERLEEMGAEIHTSGQRPTPTTPPPEVGIYGTAHTADRLATLPNGIMLAQGGLIHRPRIIGEVRLPDHAYRQLPGGGWWWLSRNTVPVRGKRPFHRPVGPASPGGRHHHRRFRA